jgi:hypothetical protein
VPDADHVPVEQRGRAGVVTQYRFRSTRPA